MHDNSDTRPCFTVYTATGERIHVGPPQPPLPFIVLPLEVPPTLFSPKLETKEKLP